MRPVKARAVNKALANCVIGRPALADVKGTLEKAPRAHAGLAVPRVNSVTSMVPLAQALELFAIKFHGRFRVRFRASWQD